jgi:hypothetical protein
MHLLEICPRELDSSMAVRGQYSISNYSNKVTIFV